MDRKKIIYISIMIIITVFASVTYFSYAFFASREELKGRLNIVAGTLDYKIESEDLNNNSITLEANESKQIELTITSLNTIDSEYELYYEDTSDIEVGYLTDNDTPTGEITSNGTKTVSVVIKNNSNTSKIVTFGVQGGFVNKELVLATNRNSLIESAGLCIAGTVYEFPFDPDGDGEGQVQTFAVPCDGVYKLEVWGAQGSTNEAQASSTGGKGGYSVGEVTLAKDNILNIIVGGNYGYNGGGGAIGNNDGQSIGGGATHIARQYGTYTTLASYNNAATAQNYVYLVAGGGGGGGNIPYSNNGQGYGGSGGGASGENGVYAVSDATLIWSKRAGGGGTQTAGGVYGLCYDGTSQCGMAGTFGQGGGIYNCNNSQCLTGSQAGGGGGWYGGGSARHAGGGGGSGWIGGVTDGETIVGNQSMPTHDGTGTMTGNTGNGYAKITYLGTRKVTFNANGGNVSENTRTVNYGYEIGTLPTPTKTNYAFKGWYLDSGFTTEVDSTYIVTEDITLYAKWSNVVEFTLAQLYYDGVDISMNKIVYTDINGISRIVAPSEAYYSNSNNSDRGNKTTISTLVGSKVYIVSNRGNDTIWDDIGISGVDRVYFYMPPYDCQVLVNCTASRGNNYGHRDFSSNSTFGTYCNPTFNKD